MSHYLIEGSYTGASAKAMVASPTDRSVQAKSVVESLGGTFYHFFFALGDSDFILLCEAPDDSVVMAISLAVGASGSFSRIKTTKLITAAEAQQAMTRAKSAKYSPPAVGT
ncbi:MAG TPA: GYD domain-containing protein [Lichenihabitans sp.]|jgi:uncharacterized protein with GYD domain|nr:GYD domain-containing protein [Lichenihabitans sp.]